ncbi:hypothetical protein [Paenibacillus tengchongensis]|uniref:hypothetical protein n=1 Tax=Paenibacillus tengchongensis TaxID=2608684 RepID=UPI00124D0808|nr:hypothetical protein [Paenibacillus tengchongensis]
MTDKAKRAGAEPVFDTDRAWERFEGLAQREPVPAFWTAPAEDCRDSGGTAPRPQMTGMEAQDEKDGVIHMLQSDRLQDTPAMAAAPAAEAADTARTGKAAGAWKTERPARRRLRRAAAGVTAAAIAVGLFTTPLGDRVLASMQHTFRIQQMVGVSITADDMTAISSLLENGSPAGDRSFNLAQYGSLSQSSSGEALDLSWNEAEARMGGNLLRLEDSAGPVFQPASKLTFNLNVKAVNRLLARFGSGTALPSEADGQPITLSIPDGVVSAGSLSGHPVRLLQFGKPELTVGNGIDPQTVRDAVLGLPVLPDSLRTKLAAIGDWQNTLPVPAVDGTTTVLKLNGYDAVMAEGGAERFLLWLDGDRMSLLSGSTQDFPTDASFTQAAQELMQQ